MKKYLLLSFFLLSSCSPHSNLKIIEWRDHSKAPKPTETTSFKAPKIASGKNENVSIAPQTLSGVPIENTYIKVVQTSAGQDKVIRAQLSEIFLPKPVETDLVKAFKDNEKLALTQILQKYPYFKRQTFLKISPLLIVEKNQYVLTWVFSYFDKTGRPWEARFNEKTLLKDIKRVGSQFHDTLAIIYPEGPKKSQLQTVQLKQLVANPTLSNEKLHVSSQADDKISEVTNVLNFSPSDSRFDQVQVFYYLQESLNWFERFYNFKLPYQLNAEVHVGYPDKTNAAFYYSGKIRLGAGDNETYKNLPQDPSIVIHESVHALVDTLAGLPFDGEGGSLNEGFADFITALQRKNPHMAEASYLKGPYRRSVSNSLRLQDKNGGVYHDSSIISGLLWEISLQLGQSKSRDLAIYILNRLTPGSDFQDFGSILKEVMFEYFNTPQDLKIVESIMKERGFSW